MFGRTFVLALTALSLGFAPAPLPRSDKAGLVGTWEVIAHTLRGRSGNVERREDILVITPTQVPLHRNGEPYLHYRLMLDTNRSPPTLDLEKRGNPIPSLGVVRQQGHTMKIAFFADESITRPTTLDETDERLEVVTLRRLK